MMPTESTASLGSEGDQLRVNAIVSRAIERLKKLLDRALLLVVFDVGDSHRQFLPRQPVGSTVASSRLAAVLDSRSALSAGCWAMAASLK